jgi:RND family efflux transporter MFP subunit
LCACGEEVAPAPEEPAHIENPVVETDLTTIHLTELAVERIGIVAGRVEEMALARMRSTGGELVAPSGTAIVISAPRAAVVLPPESGPIPEAGTFVNAGEPVLRLAVLPSQDALSGPEQMMAAAEARLENARARADRASQLLADGVASVAEYDDAVAELRTAESGAVTARALADLLRHGYTDADLSSLAPVVILAPRDGQLLAVHVGAGQTVGDGTALLEIIDSDPLWVRIPVFPGDAAAFDRRAEAFVSTGDHGSLPGVPVTPIAGPATADPSTVSVDLYYELQNSEGLFRAGERVSVRLPILGGGGPTLAVPWSAVVHDIYGGAWVYEDLSGGAYARRRVEVADVTEGFAILSRGPAAGTPVVVVGAAELFSTEFGEDAH